MFDYPVNLDLTGRQCGVIGGGKVAWRKVKTLVDAGAQVTVISPELSEPLQCLLGEKLITFRQKSYAEGDLAGFFLVICAADNAAVNLQAAMEARQNGSLVNVTDGSSPSDFAVPAQLRRGDLLLTVSTGGKSPAIARQIRDDLAAHYGVGYGDYLTIVAKLRVELKADYENSNQRVLFWQKAMCPEIMELVRQGKLEKAEAELKNAISSFRAES